MQRRRQIRTTPPPTAPDWQGMLSQAQQQLFLLLTGQLPAAVDTPQLGRVQFSATNPADLQRLIDYLQGQIAAEGSGGSMTTGSSAGRSPISIMAWP